MNRSRMILSVLIAALVLPLVLDSSCSTGEKNEAKRVLGSSIKALGGQSRLTGWTTRVEKGTIISIRPGWGTLKGACTHYIQKPDKLVWDQDFSAYDNPFYFVYSYNGGDGWYEVNLGVRQNQNVTDLMAKKLKEIDDVAYFYANCDSFYIVADVADDSLFAAADFTRIGCSGPDMQVFYDIRKSDLMPVRKVEPTANGENTTLMDDYRKISDGRKVPFHQTVYQNGVKTTEFLWEDIEYGAAIDPAVFEKNRPVKE